MKKEDLDVDPQSMDNRRLSAIARNPNHPMHTHAKSELERRKMTKEGAMKRIATTQASKTDRMASTDKKGLDTFKKKPTTEAKDPEEYDNEGSMMKSQLRQICSANEKLMSMVKDDDNLPEWVQAKVTKATDYIRSVRDYLESEKMEEKTLTPAELKKREKIAKAIERDNPDMPMDKKMAIATATAKRVAESKDDEYHKTLGQTKNSDEGIAALKKKHGMSHTKAVATLKRLMGEQKVNEDKRSEIYHSHMKTHKLDEPTVRMIHQNPDDAESKRMMKNPKYAQAVSLYKNSMKTEATIKELDKKTLGSYIKKASDDRAKNAYDIGKSGKINYKGLKRRQGINRAVNKMAAESTLDRIKKILDR